MDHAAVVSALFEVVCHTTFGEEVRIVGSNDQLGKWDPKKGCRLHTDKDSFPVWRSSPLLLNGNSVEYKYVIVKSESGEAVWDQGDNRRIDVQAIRKMGATDGFLFIDRWGEPRSHRLVPTRDLYRPELLEGHGSSPREGPDPFGDLPCGPDHATGHSGNGQQDMQRLWDAATAGRSDQEAWDSLCKQAEDWEREDTAVDGSAEVTEVRAPPELLEEPPARAPASAPLEVAEEATASAPLEVLESAFGDSANEVEGVPSVQQEQAEGPTMQQEQAEGPSQAPDLTLERQAPECVPAEQPAVQPSPAPPVSVCEDFVCGGPATEVLGNGVGGFCASADTAFGGGGVSAGRVGADPTNTEAASEMAYSPVVGVGSELNGVFPPQPECGAVSDSYPGPLPPRSSAGEFAFAEKIDHVDPRGRWPAPSGEVGSSESLVSQDATASPSECDAVEDAREPVCGPWAAEAGGVASSDSLASPRECDAVHEPDSAAGAQSPREPLPGADLECAVVKRSEVKPSPGVDREACTTAKRGASEVSPLLQDEPAAVYVALEDDDAEEGPRERCGTLRIVAVLMLLCILGGCGAIFYCVKVGRLEVPGPTTTTPPPPWWVKILPHHGQRPGVQE